MPEAEAWAAQVDQADGFIFVTPEYNHSYPAALKNAIDHLYRQWVHKPAAIVNYGGFASGFRAAEQLRLAFIEVKMAPLREQVGISLVPGAIPGLDAEPGSPGAAYLQRALDGMIAELLWWEAGLPPARERDRAANAQGFGHTVYAHGSQAPVSIGRTRRSPLPDTENGP